jgi:diguanylate cyclase (GGDEF)-like protein
MGAFKSMRTDDLEIPERRKKQGRPQFWRVLMRTFQIAAIIDIAFFFLFHVLGSPILAWVNIFSVAIYIVAYYALKNRKNRIASLLIWVEVLAHAALGIILIGWESGFHYYLLMFIPAICLSTSRRPAYVALMLLFGFYIGLDLLSWFIEPLQPINSIALQIVHIFNLSVVFILFSYLSVFYLTTVRSAQKKLHVMATTDPLTGLFNRRYITYLADKKIYRNTTASHCIGILLIDIDHFKKINDEFGHEVGDSVLGKVAQILKSLLRTQDLIARWGGEEFLVIIPDMELGASMLIAEQIRQGFVDYDWLAATENPVNPTISVGVSELNRSESLDSAIARADVALYKCKEKGRNRIEFETL